MSMVIPSISLKSQCRALRARLAMRFAYAHDYALMSVGYGHEADDHYSYGPASRSLELRRYTKGYLEGLFVRNLPTYWTDSWLMPVRPESTR